MKPITLDIEIGVFYNDPASGYITVGSATPDIANYKNHGFIVKLEPDGSSSAVLCSSRPTGNRSSQFNIFARWKETLPFGYLPALKAWMSSLDETTFGMHTVSLSFVKLASTASADLICSIRQALGNDVCLLINAESYDERSICQALARIPVPQRSLTVALPLPSNHPPCDISLIDSNTNIAQSDKFYVSVAPGSAHTDDQIIAASPEKIADWAIHSNDHRVYDQYIMLKTNPAKLMNSEKADHKCLQAMLDRMDHNDLCKLLFSILASKQSSQKCDQRPNPKQIPVKSKSYTDKKHATRTSVLKVAIVILCFVATGLILTMTGHFTHSGTTFIINVSHLNVITTILGLVWGFVFGYLIKN